MKNPLLAKCLAEFIGTFALVFAGCGSLMIADRFDLPTAHVPLVFGLVIACMIYALGHISGAHFNPAVTLAFTFTKLFPRSQAAFYLLAQFTGALFAMLTLVVLLPEGESFGATLPSVPWWQAFSWEVILSFFLMLVIMAVATDARAAGTMAGLAIGGTVLFCALLGGPITGASMNPARSLAPQLWHGELHLLWIYILAPIFGAFLAGHFYQWIRCHFPAQTEESTEKEPLSSSAKGCC